MKLVKASNGVVLKATLQSMAMEKFLAETSEAVHLVEQLDHPAERKNETHWIDIVARCQPSMQLCSSHYFGLWSC